MRALLDVAAAPLLGTAAGLAVIVALSPEKQGQELESWTSTWPLVPLVAAGLWGGILAGGGTRGEVVHRLARPPSRSAILLARVAPLVASLLAAGLALHAVAAAVPLVGGPALYVVVTAIGLATASGSLAGILTEQEAMAVGGAVLGLGVLLAPPYVLVEALGLSWGRIDNALGVWVWVLAAAAIGSLALPVALAWRRLPRRSTRLAVGCGIEVVALSMVQAAVAWTPAAVAATAAGFGDAVAVYAVDDRTLLVTGSRATTSSHQAVADGIVLLDGDRRLDLWEISLRERLRGTRVLGLEPAPTDLHAVAIAYGPPGEAYLTIVGIPDGRSLAPPIDLGLDGIIDGVRWSDQRELVVRSRGTELAIAWDGGVLVSGRPTPGEERPWTCREAEPSTCARLSNAGPTTLEILTPVRAGTRLVRLEIDPSRQVYLVDWLDDDHLALGVRGHGELYVVDRGGRVAAHAISSSGLSIRRALGPASGPWVVRTPLGRCRGVGIRRGTGVEQPGELVRSRRRSADAVRARGHDRLRDRPPGPSVGTPGAVGGRRSMIRGLVRASATSRLLLVGTILTMCLVGRVGATMSPDGLAWQASEKHVAFAGLLLYLVLPTFVIMLGSTLLRGEHAPWSWLLARPTGRLRIVATLVAVDVASVIGCLSVAALVLDGLPTEFVRFPIVGGSPRPSPRRWKSRSDTRVSTWRAPSVARAG